MIAMAGLNGEDQPKKDDAENCKPCDDGPMEMGNGCFHGVDVDGIGKIGVLVIRMSGKIQLTGIFYSTIRSRMHDETATPDKPDSWTAFPLLT